VANEFDWTASEMSDTEEADRLYREQSEALALALMVNRQATLLLSAFNEYPSDHERIAACRRAFRSAARLVSGAKVRTTMLRDSEGTPSAVLGYIDAPTTEEELRRAMGKLDFGS
jgi:hypothetical protein